MIVILQLIYERNVFHILEEKVEGNHSVFCCCRTQDFHSIYNHVELQGMQLLIMCTHSLPDMYACTETDILAYADVIIIIVFPKNQNQPWDRVGYGEFFVGTIAGKAKLHPFPIRDVLSSLS